MLDEIGDNQRHPLYSLHDTLGTEIHAYEETHHQIPETRGREMRCHLMEEHGLIQPELPEIGSQGAAFEVLNGKRELHWRHAAALSNRFAFSPSVFL